MSPELVYRLPEDRAEAAAYAIGREYRAEGLPSEPCPFITPRRARRYREGWEHMDKALKMLCDKG